MFKNKRINDELSRKLSFMQEDIEKLQEENDKLKEENKELDLEIRNLKSDLNDEQYKNLSSKKEIQRAKDEKELIEMKNRDMEDILEEYRQLPDLKNMIDNLSSLTSPSIDKLIDLVKHTDFKELTKFNERISSIEQKLDTLIDLFRGRRFF